MIRIILVYLCVKTLCNLSSLVLSMHEYVMRDWLLEDAETGMSEYFTWGTVELDKDEGCSLTDGNGGGCCGLL